MAIEYQEYCPEGNTDKTIKFTIEGNRVPTPTFSCICQGLIAPEVISERLQAFLKGLGSIGIQVPIFTEKIQTPIGDHNSAIRKIT